MQAEVNNQLFRLESLVIKHTNKLEIDIYRKATYEDCWIAT